MKNFKHIISYACDKNCSYCINELLVHHEKQCKDEVRIAQAYEELALDSYDHILLSGGEPVLNKMFNTCLKLASLMFKKVSIITAHNSSLSNKMIEKYADDVLFSFHSEYMGDINEKTVEIDIPVYASMVVEGYLELRKATAFPLFWLKKRGFSGATIRETYPEGEPLPDLRNIPDNFSIKTHTRDNCVKDSLLLLPDLTTATEQSFNPKI